MIVDTLWKNSYYYIVFQQMFSILLIVPVAYQCLYPEIDDIVNVIILVWTAVLILLEIIDITLAYKANEILSHVRDPLNIFDTIGLLCLIIYTLDALVN